MTRIRDDQNIKKMEAMGVEPMSEIHQTSSATCLVSVYTNSPHRKRNIGELGSCVIPIRLRTTNPHLMVLSCFNTSQLDC